MSRAPLSSAEADFFWALNKTAEDKEERKLDPSTKLLLGIPEQNVRDLTELEERAATYDDDLRSPEEAEEEELATEEAANGELEEQRPAEPMVADASVPMEDMEAEPAPAPMEEGEVVDEGFVEEELPPPPEPVPEPKPEPPSREQFHGLFSNRRAHPLVLAEVLRGKYNDTWVKWEPETLWWVIRRDFGRIGELCQNKIMALRVALQTSFPWQDWDVFEKCGIAWNDHVPVFGAYQPMQPSQAAFTVSVLQGLHPEFEFEHEIAAYLAAVCDEAGFVYAPEDWFPGAQAVMDKKDWLVAFRTDVESAWTRLQELPPEELEQLEFQQQALDIHIGKLIAVREYLAVREGLRSEQTAAESPTLTTTSPPPAVA